ncbi:error-prone DNA polymerase [Streptomyces sp. MnatMP-M17]|nr:error-prone DNA polymerase [Streptomyces sp. MnatMP-M17]
MQVLKAQLAGVDAVGVVEVAADPDSVQGAPGRGVVNYALFVATANPLEHRLLFERFMSERRTSLPDIDLDVESARCLDAADGRPGREVVPPHPRR